MPTCAETHTDTKTHCWPASEPGSHQTPCLTSDGCTVLPFAPHTAWPAFSCPQSGPNGTPSARARSGRNLRSGLGLSLGYMTQGQVVDNTRPTQHNQTYQIRQDPAGGTRTWWRLRATQSTA